MRSVYQTAAAALVLVAASAAPGWAATIGIGDAITVQLIDHGFGDPDPAIVNTTVSAGLEVSEGDGSDIGSGLMLDGEYIDVAATSIVFSIHGGGIDAAAGGTTTGYGPGARYVISGLVDPALGEITGVSLLFEDVVGVTLGAEALFSAHSVTLYIDTLGILFDGFDNLGTVTMNLTIRDITDPGPIPAPEPGTLRLRGSGVAAAWTRRRSLRRT